ncbi:MAG: alpha/beta fold hydrolase [Acetobacterium sp.]
MEKKSVHSERGITYYWINRNLKADPKCIVFTHGLTANHTMFEKQVDYFSENYTVITWDVPLHGESRPYSDFSYKNTAKELLAILEEEKIYKVIIVGMSMGGYPCQEFAIRCNDRIRAFIAIDTTPFGLCFYSKSDQWWLKRVEPIARCIPDRLLRWSMAKSVSATQYAYDLMIKMLVNLSKHDICEQIGIAYADIFTRTEPVHFDFPVLILVGEHDKTGKVMQYSREWAKREGYPLQVIKNAAHFSNADNYTDVNKAIDEFISSLSA